MEITNEEIRRYALALGLSDIRFAAADSEVHETSGAVVTPRTFLPEATCMIVLFADYLPAEAAPAGSMALSSYYPASNLAYHAAIQLTAWLREHGAKAQHCLTLSAREAALQTGGFIGDNGFYYHERFGSFTCIQVVLTDAAQPEEYAPADSLCTHCGACKSACRAVDHPEGCLRLHINGLVPEALRGSVYQLFGCEKCQSVCPLNRQSTAQAHVYNLKGLLTGRYTQELKEIAGANLVRKNRLLSHAVLYAANTKQYELSGLINELAQSAPEPVRSHALWAYQKLSGEKND